MVRIAIQGASWTSCDARSSDCLHAAEPDCAVRSAADSGAIRRARFESYRRILASLDDG